MAGFTALEPTETNCEALTRELERTIEILNQLQKQVCNNPSLPDAEKAYAKGKKVHTDEVMALWENLQANAAFSKEIHGLNRERLAIMLAAHDLGRFSQGEKGIVRQDKDFDHALKSAQIMKNEEILSNDVAVFLAVKYHSDLAKERITNDDQYKEASPKQQEEILRLWHILRDIDCVANIKHLLEFRDVCARPLPDMQGRKMDLNESHVLESIQNRRAVDIHDMDNNSAVDHLLKFLGFRYQIASPALQQYLKDLSFEQEVATILAKYTTQTQKQVLSIITPNKVEENTAHTQDRVFSSLEQ